MYESLHPETSLWTPYFSLLPKTESFHSLMFWDAAELEDLQGSMVLGKIGKEEAEEEFETVLKPFVEEHESVLGPKEGYTLEKFHWCGSLVLSRSFHVDAKEEESDDEDEEEEEEKEDVADVAMVPMADLLNAKSGADNVSCGALSFTSTWTLTAHTRSIGSPFLRTSHSQHDVYLLHLQRLPNLQHLRRPPKLGPAQAIWSRRR